jgi:hypothetical protein
MHIQGDTYSADLEWDKEGRPILWVTGHGKVTSPKDAIGVIAAGVQMVNESQFNHVCAVYDMLDNVQIPMLARFIRSGAVPTTSRTAHIIIGTHNAAIQLVASLIAVATGKRLRTMEVCKTREEIDAAVKRWLNLPDNMREYTINNV